MKRLNRVIAFLALGLVSTAALAWCVGPSGGEMTAAAGKFVDSLTEEQRGQTLLAIDATERTDWHYIPKPSRKGLQVKEMTEPQKQAAFELLRAALSDAGYGKTRKIMQLESVLRELEKTRAGGPLRDPDRYYFTLFGTPKPDGRWGLSVEGHHLSLNFVVNNNQVVSSTPTFLGANPGKLMADYGPEFPQGLRVLGKEEERAYQLLDSLSPAQRRQAIVADKAPNDVRGAGQASPPLTPAVGLTAKDMTAEQRQMLRDLIAEFAHTLPADVASMRLEAIERSGFDGIKFSWAGSDQPGSGHDYRIQGATFLIEFNNTQPDSAGNLANHIHSTWHNLAGNFDVPAAKK